MPHPKLDFRGN